MLGQLSDGPNRGQITCAEPPCCWCSRSEPAHRQNQRSGTRPHRTGPPATLAAWERWEEATLGALRRWTTSPALWNLAGAQREVLFSCCPQLSLVWRSWLVQREAPWYRSPAGARCDGIRKPCIWHYTQSKLNGLACYCCTFVLVWFTIMFLELRQEHQENFRQQRPTHLHVCTRFGLVSQRSWGIFPLLPVGSVL